MLKEITADVGRYEAGGKHDYPKGVWDKIAADLLKDPKNAELFQGFEDEPLKAFTRPVDINATHQSATRGPIKLRQRTGSPARIPARGAA